MIKLIQTAKVYSANWEVRMIDDLNTMSEMFLPEVKIVQGDFDISCKFTLKDTGESMYFACDTEWQPAIDSVYPLDSLVLKTLFRGSEEDLCGKVVHKNLMPDWEEIRHQCLLKYGELN